MRYNTKSITSSIKIVDVNSHDEKMKKKATIDEARKRVTMVSRMKTRKMNKKRGIDFARFLGTALITFMYVIFLSK